MSGKVYYVCSLNELIGMTILVITTTKYHDSSSNIMDTVYSHVFMYV